MNTAKVEGRHFGHPPAKRQLETIGPAIAGAAPLALPAKQTISQRAALSATGADMLRVQKVRVNDIYVPTARKKTLHPETVRHLAEDILENGMKMPIQVRHDGKRHILVEGLHRLEAAKWLGETEIDAYLVQAKRH
ncbi:ParB N-terminal domain-containing protein [Mesorhizobium sp. M0800]